MTNDNPYAPPSDRTAAEDSDAPGQDVPARRFTRLAAAIVDGFLMMAVVIPIQLATGYTQRALNGQVSVFEEVVMSLLGLVVFLALNGYLLVNHGQSIGKRFGKIQIVDAADGTLLPFSRVYVIRYLWTLPLVVIVLAIPGRSDDALLYLAVLFDALLIFGVARRCLHDYLAGSKVVMYRPGRERAA